MTTAATEEVVGALIARGVRVSVAESLTGGLVLAELTSVPGASAVVRGGMVVYATASKSDVLGVDPGVLDEHGPVSEPVAKAMAEAVRLRFSTEIGVATTGVAGPDSQDGHPVGEVYIAVARGSAAGEVTTVVRRLNLTGGRVAVREQTVAAAVGLLAVGLREHES